jgi:hypothetical protein
VAEVLSPSPKRRSKTLCGRGAMIYKTFLLALREDVEPSIQDPNNKRRRRPSNTIKKYKGMNFTEAKRRDSEVLGIVERSSCETAL